MADAIIYSSLDPAGPGLRPTNSTVNNSLAAIQRTYDILVPCLVTGYGIGPEAKPGQGWELIHTELPIGFTLKAPDGVFYVFYKGPNVVAPGSSAGAAGVQAFMAENIQAPFTYPPTGTNVRSGDFASSNPGELNRHWISFSHSANPENKWFLIANGPRVLFMRDSITWDQAGGDSAESGANQNSSMLFLGCFQPTDPTAPRTGPQVSLVQGGYYAGDALSASSTALRYGNHLGDLALIPSNTDNPGTTAAGCTRLRDFLSGAVEVATLARTTCNPAKHGRGTGITRHRLPLMPPDLRLEQADVWLAGVGSIGKLPGLFYGGRVCHYVTADLMAALGKGASLGDCLIPLEIDGEPFYILPTGFGSLFISLLEKYWT